MIKANWYPVNGVAWENVFPCQRERCTAWVPSVDEEIFCKEGLTPGFGDCKEASTSTTHDCNECYYGRLSERIEGYCKLIERH